MAKRATTKKKTKKAAAARATTKGAAARKARRATTGVNKAVKAAKAAGKAATAARVVGGAAAGGIAGPALVALTVLGSQMKKDSALAKFLNKSKGDTKGKSPGPKDKTKKGPSIRAKKSAMTDEQRKSGGKGISQAAAFNREKGRGKVGPKRNVIKTSTGILRDKSGKAVKRLSREEVLKRRKANR